MSDIWEFYTDLRGEWRWRKTEPNGHIVGSSSQGYNSRLACVENARRHGFKGNFQPVNKPQPQISDAETAVSE